MAPRRASARKHGRRPRERDGEDVGRVVPRVRQKRDRAGVEAGPDFGDHNQQIQPHAERKRGARRSAVTVSAVTVTAVTVTAVAVMAVTVLGVRMPAVLMVVAVLYRHCMAMDGRASVVKPRAPRRRGAGRASRRRSRLS